MTRGGVTVEKRDGFCYTERKNARRLFMRFNLHADGSFDLISSFCSVLNAYPAVDGVALRPVKAEVSGNTAVYTLLNGAEIRLTLSEEEGGIALSLRARKLGGAHDISPLSFAVTQNVKRFFVQGLGICGPSGFYDAEKEVLSSDGLIALCGENGCAALYAVDHSRFRFHFRAANGYLSASFDTEKAGGDDLTLPTVFFAEGEGADGLLRGIAGKIAAFMGARPVTKQAFHWCSWYYLYHNLDEELLKQYAKGFREKNVPFTHLQIDAGYFTSCGDWLKSNARFPGGMENAGKIIRDAGYEPGVWIAPYMVGDESDVYKNHKDWLLRDNDGSLHVECRCYNEPKMWGYRDCDYFVLDTSNPEALAYIKNVFATYRKWGYTLFKTDFLFWGLKDSTQVKRHTPGKTSFEYFRELMSAIREAIGPESRWLGCIAPFLPCVGCADMMRIAGDVGAQWEAEGFGPTNMLRELTADQYFNNVYWQNDPDAVMLRDFHIYLETPQIEALALMEAMSGGAVYTSAPVHLMDESRRKLLSFLRSDMVHTAVYPFWEEGREELVILQKLSRRRLLYFMNPTARPICRSYDFKKLLGEDVKYVRQWRGECLPVEQMKYVELESRCGKLFFADSEPIDEDPENMWQES